MVDQYMRINKESIEDFLAKQGRLIELMKLVRKGFESKSDKELLTFINTLQFFAVNTFDMLVAIKSIITTNKYVERNLYARVVSMICYQIPQENHTMTSKEFRKCLKNLSNDNIEALGGHDMARKVFTNYEKKHADFFQEIRNNSIAHRNKNLGAQIEFIENLDVDKVLKLSLDLFVIIDRYNQYLTKFVDAFASNIQARLN